MKNFAVTGTSSGFGLEMARCALAHGDRVVATLRKPEVLNDLASKHTSQQLLVLRLDVSKPDEIKATFAKAKEVFGRIDVVFNNAGYAVAGEAEAIADDAARSLFDVNFWGAAHVSQEAVRFFREENSPRGGRLIQNSATISSVLPGGFVTDILQKFQMLPQHPAYADPTNAASLIRKYFGDGRDKEGFKAQWSDPAKGVQKIYELSQLADPPLRLLLGKDANHYVGEYLARLTREVEQYASWSDDLRYDTN